MVLEELGRADARVCATDISTQALDRARTARYSARETAGLSSARRARFLVGVGDQFQIAPDVRSRVEIAFQNLATDAPPFAPGACPVVLCRNVLIYFSHEGVIRLLDRIADWLPPGGWLFLGYSESLWQATGRFQLVRVGDTFVYRRREAGLPRRDIRAGSHFCPTTAVERRAYEHRTSGVEVAHVPPLRVSNPRAQIDALLAQGEAATRAGDHAAAIEAFRKSAYLDPERPITLLHLGLALEASGDPLAAHRGYSAARHALVSCDIATIEAVLEGYQVDELARLLDRKLVKSP